MAVSKQKKFMFGIIYSMVLVFTLCFSGLVVSSYIKEKQEFERFKQTWQYRADTNFTQSIETDEETGEQTVVYNISTPEQLAGMFVHSEKVQADSATSHIVNDKYQLTQNLSLSASSWSSSNSFSGTFYGNGFVISGIGSPFVNSLTGTVKDIVFENVRISMSGNAGVVANSSTGTIKNVQVVSGSVLGSSNVGGLVGEMTGGSIINCTNKASVSGGSNIGGIVGTVSSCTITNSANYASISLYSVGAPSRVGGIAGYFSGTSAKVTYCVNRGAVKVNASCSSGLDVGGIVGYIYQGSISWCANYADVNATNKGSTKTTAGGIAGRSDVGISDCYNGGAISGSRANSSTTTTISTNLGGSGVYYGGAAENPDSATSREYKWYVCDSTYTSSASQDSGTYQKTTHKSSYYEELSAYKGGIVGDCSKTISRCYNKGNVSADTGSTKTVTLYFKDKAEYVGLWVYSTSFNKLLTWKITYTTGYTFGPICGNSSASLSYCYNNSSISYNYKVATISVKLNNSTALSSWAVSSVSSTNSMGHTGNTAHGVLPYSSWEYNALIDASNAKNMRFIIRKTNTCTDTRYSGTSDITYYTYNTGLSNVSFSINSGTNGTPSFSGWTDSNTKIANLYW